MMCFGASQSVSARVTARAVLACLPCAHTHRSSISEVLSVYSYLGMVVVGGASAVELACQVCMAALMFNFVEQQAAAVGMDVYIPTPVNIALAYVYWGFRGHVP